MIALLIVLTLPYTPHSTGSDSFFFQEAARSLVENGFLKWIRNPLSFFGMNSYSYPSGLIYFTSEVMVLTGLGIEDATYIVSLGFVLSSFFSMYLLSSTLTISKTNKIIFSFLFSSSPYILRWSTFTLSTRLFFIIIFIYSLYFFFLYLQKHDTRFFILFIIFLFFLLFSHRMFILAYATFLFVIVCYPLTRIVSNKNKFYESSKLFLSGLILFTGALAIWGGIWKSPNTFVFEMYDNPIQRLSYLVFYFGRDIGPSIMLMPLGFVFFCTRNRTFTLSIFLMILLLSYFIVSWFYVFPLLIPITFLFSILGFNKISGKYSMKSRHILLFLVTLSIAFSIFSQFYHHQSRLTGVDRHMRSDTFSFIGFLNKEINNRILAHMSFGTQIGSLSYPDILSQGNEPIYLLYGIVDSDNLEEKFVIASGGRRIFVPTHGSVRTVFENLYYKNITDKYTQETLKTYDIDYLTESKDYSPKQKILLDAARKNCPKIYDNDNQILYRLDC